MATEQTTTGQGSGVELREIDLQPVLSIRATIPTAQLGEATSANRRSQAFLGHLPGLEPPGGVKMWSV